MKKRVTKKKIVKLIEFLRDQNKKVKESIDRYKSEYDNHCYAICLLKQEELDHILWCIKKGFDLNEYMKYNEGSKENWFELEYKKDF